MILKTHIVEWIRLYSSYIAENKEYLTELDAAIGDADHGINMARGFNEVSHRMASLDSMDIGNIFKNVGMTLLSKVGGASGALYGTLFLRMGMAAAGKEELNSSELLAELTAGVEGIRQRGSARPGEKTMVDALEPAVTALRAALDGGAAPCEALRAAEAAAKEGMEATIPMQATKGRASYLGPRSVGHQDPGATSAYLLIKAAADALCAQNGS
ncbi:MAG: dihydroxyacetone kinase subunit L [Caldilineaceae bacterium]|nr:dihydroxyacetone kinase subunit L [Caldilineaceae bacterium]